MMIGQTRLLATIDSFVNLPKSIILVGEHGSGRHLIAQYVADKVGYEIIDITEVFDKTVIDSMAEQPSPKIYIIDLDLVDLSKHSFLLKTLEEPVPTVNIILLTSSLTTVLPTIQSRCHIWHMDKYSKEDLRHFTSDEQILLYASTPGKIKEYEKFDITYYQSVCENILKNIHKASFGNLFNISEIFNFKDNVFDLFLPILLDVIKQHIIRGESCTEEYKLTSTLLYNSKIAHVDKKKLFEVYLFRLKEIPVEY